jgi:hypothetical protein
MCTTRATWTADAIAVTDPVLRRRSVGFADKVVKAGKGLRDMGLNRVLSPRRTAVVAAVVVTAGLAMASQFVPPARAATSAAGEPAWLATINYWRAATGLPPVTDNPAWDQGLLNHFIYLAKTPATYKTGQYASLHTENPASPYYTASGAKEAASSDLAPGASTDLGALDEWLAAPFHAIGMLRPDLTQVALAVGDGYGGLDVISGLNGNFQQTAPILYPGSGSTTSLLDFGGELPDPTQTCGWQGDTVGLPLIMMLASTPSQSLSATLTGPSGALESSAAKTLCVVDQFTYYSTDTVYGPTGLDILQGGNAVLLIPRHPLVPGSYTVSVSQPGQAGIDWSFQAAGPPGPPTVSAPRFAGGIDGHPRLAITAVAGTSAPPLKRIKLVLPRGLSFSRKRATLMRDVTVKVDGKAVGFGTASTGADLVITLASPATRLTVRAVAPAVVETRTLERELRRAASTSLSMGVRLYPTSGPSTAFSEPL